MKTVTTYFKTIALIIAMGLAGKGSAQCALSAGFTYTVNANGYVIFESTSTGTIAYTQYLWNFGDGTISGMTPIGHNFPANGTYTVTLAAANYTGTPGCTDTISQVIAISNITCNINASYAASQSTFGLVNFSNSSTGTSPGVTYLWDFGDGSTSTSPSPAHTFSANGVYTISLTADNNYSYTCNSTATSTIYINSYCTFTTSFTPSYGANGIVTLNSTSNNLLFDSWDFGDGTPPTYPQTGGTPVNHTYQNGSYLVTLTAINQTWTPNCTSTYTQMINVTSYSCNLNANFTYTALPTSTIANAFYFDASSTTGVNANTNYFWNFGDGTTFGPLSYNTGAWHAFPTAGTYSVLLVVSDATDPGCVDSMYISVTATVCVADASFTLYPSGTPQQWIVSPNAPYNVTSATWSWGDGTTTNTLYTSHTYSAAGTYTLCLTVTASCGAVDSECSSYYVYKSAESNAMIGVTVVAPNTPTGIKNMSADKNAFTIYPNPGNGLIHLSASNPGDAKIMVYDLLGNVIYNETAELSTSQAKAIQLNDVSNGIYLVKVISGDKTFTQRIVISK